MNEFSLGLDSSINGIYLNSETIELLSIIQCENLEDLQEYARNCSQLDISEESIASWNEQNIEDLKRYLFEKYKGSIIPLKQSIEDRASVLKSALQHCGISEQEMNDYISELNNNGYDGIKQKLLKDYPEKYAEFAEKQHRFIASERDQMTEVSYEEISAINDKLKNHNTILVASGRYYDITNKLYDENDSNENR